MTLTDHDMLRCCAHRPCCMICGAPGKPLTDATLDEIEARAKAATPGPWVADGHHDSGEIRIRATSQAAIEIRLAALSPEEREMFGEHDAICLGIEVEPYNATFIAHARADVPALIAALRASREETARLRGALVDAALRRCCDQVPPSATDGMGFMTLRDEAGHAVVHVDGCTARAALGEEPTS